jgi:NAD-dependent deacetylase
MVRCTQCQPVVENRDLPIAILPLCTTCGGLLRPHIVWFGESLAEEDLGHSEAALQCSDLCLIIGTSGLVYPAAGFASVAKQAGAFVVEINLDPTPHTGLVDASLRGRAKDIVPLLLQS